MCLVFQNIWLVFLPLIHKNLQTSQKFLILLAFRQLQKRCDFPGIPPVFHEIRFPPHANIKKRCRSPMGTTAFTLFFAFSLSSAQLSWLVFGSICVVLFHIRVLPAVFSILRRRLSNAADAATHSGAWFRETVSPQGRKI